MGWCTAQWKMLQFRAKNHEESHKFELARLKKKKKKKRRFWPSGDFLVRMLFSASGYVVRRESTRG